MRPIINSVPASGPRPTRRLRLLAAVSTVVAATAVVGVAVAAQQTPSDPPTSTTAVDNHRPVDAASIPATRSTADAGSTPPTPATPPAPPAAVAAAAAARAATSPGRYRGPAFDACTAPSNAQMKAWLTSPYRGIVIYFGGNSRGCKQPNLTAAWVKTQQAAGWHLIPLYVGPQAACSYSKAKNRISLTAPATDAKKAAEDAVTQAKSLGLPRDSVLIYNMERYRTTDTACAASVLTFLSAWTARLHDLGYLSGFYSEMTSGVPQVVAAYHRPGFVRPDYVHFARWDGEATVTDPDIPAGHWTPNRRMKQYRGPHKETWGGVTINIDNDLVDFAPLPTTRLGDVTANGWSDLVTVSPPTGLVTVHAGNGTTTTRTQLLSRWRGIDAVTRHGDFNRDKRDDVIAREKSTGHLWLYPGTGSGFGARVRIATGFTAMREITAVGDLTADGNADVLGVNAAGALLLYPGRGTSLGAPVTLTPNGWDALDELTGVGDVDGDGVTDLIARVKATDELRLYPGRKGGLGTPREINTPAAGLRKLTGVGDFDRDGVQDLMATDAAGVLYRYPIGPAALGAGVRISSGMTGQSLS